MYLRGLSMSVSLPVQPAPARFLVPLFGSSILVCSSPFLYVPPSSRLTTQSVSLSCCESARSPVRTAFSSDALEPSPCAIGLVRKRLSWRMVRSDSCGIIASCGRQAEEAMPEGSSSAASIRAGDSSSESWKSLIWAK